MITLSDTAVRRWIRDSVIAIAFFAVGMVVCRQCTVPGPLAVPSSSVAAVAGGRGIHTSRTVEQIAVPVPLQPLSLTLPLRPTVRRTQSILPQTAGETRRKVDYADPESTTDSLHPHLWARGGPLTAYRGDTVVPSTRDTISVVCDCVSAQATLDIRYAPRMATVERIHDSTTVTIVRKAPLTIGIGAGAIMNPLSTGTIMPGIFLGVSFNIVEIIF
jgi:hypothetical protein